MKYIHENAEAIKRSLWVVAIFVLSIVPLKRESGHISAEILSMMGIIVFFYGAIRWTPAHPVFARLGRLVGVHRYVPGIFYPVVFFAVFLVIAISASWYCFHFIPAYADSIAQYVHGKFIASGQLYGQSPPMRRFYPVDMMVNDGKWYAQYQPLHEMLLGLGHVIHAPWLINPLEGALTAALIYLLAQRIFGEATARIAGLLAVCCPFMVFMSAEFMNHVTALLFTTLMVFAYVEMLEAFSHHGKNAGKWAIAVGFSLGAVFLTRPLDAIGVGFPFAVHALLLLRKEFHRYIKPFAIIALAATICLIFDLWFNQQTTGSAWLFPSGKYHGGDNFAAMGSEYFSIGHMFFKAQKEWSELTIKLFEWWLPSTFFVMVFCLQPIKNRYANLLLAMIISHTIFNMANQWSSEVFGPRYLYETTSALIILTAAGIVSIPNLLRRWGIALPNQMALQGIIACPLLFLISMMWITKFPILLQGYAHGFDNHPKFYDSLVKQSETPALIFIGRGQNPVNKYKWLAFTNPPSDSSDIIFALDQGDTKDHKLMTRYPNRHAYIELDGALVSLNSGVIP